MNNLSQTIQEFDKRYKYCCEEIEKPYSYCYTCDIKSDEWEKNYWLQKADDIKRIIRELKLCVHDAKYIAELYGNLDKK